MTTDTKIQGENKRPPLNFDYIQEQANGYYVSRIFPAVGIQLQGNGKKHQPCPLCGGSDRFRCDDKNGTGSWICNQCGAGTGYTLVRDHTGNDAYETHALIADILGIDGGKPITEADKKAWAAAKAERESAEKQAKKQAQLATAKIAQERFSNATPATNHPYLAKKGVQSHGLKVDDKGNLLIPLHYHNTNTGNITLCNVQSITADGKKLFVKDGLVGGAFYTLGDTARSDVIFIAEGYATGASIYESVGGQYAIIITFDAGNMLKCASIIRTLYPQHRLIFCADDDKATEQKTGKNTGLIAGNESATLTGGEVISPDFGGDERTLTGDLTDYNDLHAHFGLDVVKAQITHALNHPRPKKQADDNPTYTLDCLLDNFAQIKDIGKITNKIYDIANAIEMTKTHFIGMVGKELANAWLFSGKQKTIDRKIVRTEQAEVTAKEYKDIFEQYWYIQGTKEVFNFKTGKRQPIETLRLEYPNEFDIWNKSEKRQKVESHNIWFDPTKRRVAIGENYINTFKDLAIQPLTAHELGVDDDRFNEHLLAGMCSPIIELVKCFCGKDTHALDWVLNWLAIPLQNLGTKMDTALIVHGHIQGAGKSLFFDRIMRRIYGDYKLTLGQGQLDSQYNDWIEGKLFSVFEEILQGKERYSQMGMVKQLITGDTVYINKKFVSGWTQDNFVNTVFLSNDMQPLSLDENDRRHVVLYPEAVIPEHLRLAVSQALDGSDEQMIRAFYTYLLLKNVGTQNAHSTAIATSAKTRLQQISMASWERFYTYWKNDELDVPYMTCLTADLYEYYTIWCKKNGERGTSSTKFLTFVGLRENKKVIRYQYPVEVGTKTRTKSGQAHAICVMMPDQNPTQNWYGDCIVRFKQAVHSSRSENYLQQTANGGNSYENDNPFV
ncbi:DUF5906 domain-containing protein [Moraxella bovis]|uniref:DUF5906 domain-containing protein n=1 Tax=Moraxella bovis TaxID=476 RepID=UPI00222791C4|nr:DUF5906 domain-containing protein [Moraxella bovis]UYZ80111.1 DUF5906 domain-containing protein [Moraxella bovis]UYZ90500.1 DUF5906 domain-containing protein [Moraxella bovis]UYZ94309.1 DUF5906 domain-containing protein [Moraxella bovis]UZA05169.1 DUF5906 domain-containing protein [Moraxella bovis]UZA12599.1 DUF5906 domain-containing protein [Moraxella bovis]